MEFICKCKVCGVEVSENQLLEHIQKHNPVLYYDVVAKDLKMFVERMKW